MSSAVSSIGNIFRGDANLADVLRIGGAMTGMSGTIKNTNDLAIKPEQKKRLAGQELNRQQGMADAAALRARVKMTVEDQQKSAIAMNRQRRMANAYGIGGSSLLGGSMPSAKTLLGG